MRFQIWPVHPRVRGEHGPGMSSEVKRHAFIPACAGNTDSRTPPTCPTPVHPRVRGEHSSVSRGSRTVSGSSPRARGTLGGLVPPKERRRFIPACAGNTRDQIRGVAGMTVHPRVRGEHLDHSDPRLTATGSSPRARGTHLRTSTIAGCQRFIPACARVRGEHASASICSDTLAGSSPRARGTQPDRPPDPRRGRFIPACAGNTSAPRSPRAGATVHPRVRGEHGTSIATNPTANGSSPRVRGTRSDGARRRDRERFIPACAGNTLCSSPRATR